MWNINRKRKLRFVLSSTEFRPHQTFALSQTLLLLLIITNIYITNIPQKRVRQSSSEIGVTQVWKGEFSNGNGKKLLCYLMTCKFGEWVPKSRDSNWKSTNASMNFNPGNGQQVKTRWTDCWSTYSWILSCTNPIRSI